MNRPAVKAGLIGAAALIVVNLVGLIPCVGCFTLILTLVVYAGVGVLTAFWMAPPRQAGPAAGQGAVAGLIAALIGGIVSTIITTAQMALMGSAQILSQIPAESLQQLRDAGIDPAAFTGPGAGAAIGSVGCVVGLVLAAGLAALGAVVYAAVKPE